MLWDIEMGEGKARERACARLQELMLRVVSQPVRARNAPVVEIPPEHRLDAVQSVVLKVLERLEDGRLPVLGQEDAPCLQYLKRMVISFEIQRSRQARREVLVSPIKADSGAAGPDVRGQADGSPGGSYRALQETLETRAIWSSSHPCCWNDRLIGLAHAVLSAAVDELLQSRRHSPRTRARLRETWQELERLCFETSGEKSSGEKSSGEKSSGEKSSGEKSSGEPGASPADRCQPRRRETAAAWRTRRNRIHKQRERLRGELVRILERLEIRRELPANVAQFGRRAVLELLNRRQTSSSAESLGK